MSDNVKVQFNEKAFDFEVDIEPTLRKAAEIAKKSMENNPKIPHDRVNYAGSFFIQKEDGIEPTFIVANNEHWMDAFINNGHLIWNSDNGTFVEGTFHYEVAQELADKYVLGSKIKLKQK